MELKLLSSKLEEYEQGWHQGQWNLVNDIIQLCDTLDKFKIPTEEEKQALAMKRNPQYPSQAEVMNSGGRVPDVVNFEKTKNKEREV